MSKSNVSRIAEAASALEAALERFDAAAGATLRAPLDSQKHLGKAGELLQHVGTLDDEVSARAQDLVAAITAARAHQQTQAGLVVERAREIERRTEVYRGLMTRYLAIGKVAAEVTRLLQTLVGAGPAAADGLGAVVERLEVVIREVKQLELDAREGDFEDVGRDAEALRQQMHAARNKLGLLQRGLTPPSA